MSNSGSTVEWNDALTVGIGALVLVLGLGLALGYLRRQKDESDLRNIFVERTQTGHAFLEEFAGLIERAEKDGANRQRGKPGEPRTTH